MIFALFAFGYVFGIVGLLLAVPLAAAIRVLLHFALKQYYASPLYADVPPAGSATSAAPTEPAAESSR
jgi:predicted PurR-regulated permease PerM